MSDRGNLSTLPFLNRTSNSVLPLYSCFVGRKARTNNVADAHSVQHSTTRQRTDLAPVGGLTGACQRCGRRSSLPYSPSFSPRRAVGGTRPAARRSSPRVSSSILV